MFTMMYRFGFWAPWPIASGAGYKGTGDIGQGQLVNYGPVNPLAGLGYEVPGVQPAGAVGVQVTTPPVSPLTATGKFLAGCGHSFNFYNVSPTSIAGVPADLLQCPECGYVDRVISQSNFYTAIVSIVSISVSLNVVTVVTSTPHGCFPTQDEIVIAGTANFNGVVDVFSVPNPTTFTYLFNPNQAPTAPQAITFPGETKGFVSTNYS
jgi:hypothetical protein